MKRILLLFPLLILSVAAWGQKVFLDGVKYDLYPMDQSAIVCGHENDISGDVTIRSTIYHEGTQYAVRAIGKYAFQNCTDVMSITIPNSVLSIADGAFHSCSNLTSISIPSTVKSIGYWAFWNCRRLKGIVIPSSVASIGNEVFIGCTALESVTIGRSVKEIGNYAFDGCTALKEIYIPNNVRTIGNYAFHNCTGLKSLILGTSVTDIGREAFAGCTALTSIILPNSVTNISGKAFAGCPNLNDIYAFNTLPKNYGCSKAAFDEPRDNQTLHIPAGSATAYSTVAPWNTFKHIAEHENYHFETDNLSFDAVADKLKYHFNFNDATAILLQQKPENISGAVTIPSTITYGGKDLNVTRIEANAFHGCNGMTSITIPRTASTIGDGALLDCPNLASISVENGNPNYDSRENCNALILTATNTLVAGCKNTTIPNSVRTIGAEAFKGCTGLAEITIPETITSIESEAFSECTNLYDIHAQRTIPGEYKCNKSAFYNVPNRCNIHVPTGSDFGYRNTSPWRVFTNIVETKVIANVGGLKYDLNPTDGIAIVTKQDASTVKGSISIPASINYNGKSYAVTKIDDDAFNGCSHLTSVAIPASVKTIGKTAFGKCNGLISISIPKTVKNIGDYAFYNCSDLTSLTFGYGMIIIGKDAFVGCVGLEDIYAQSLYSSDYKCDANIFASVPSHCILHVPENGIDNYREFSPWNKFKHIKEEQNFPNSQQKGQLRQSW